MGIKYIESTSRFLNRDCVHNRGLDLSKELLWDSVGQWASDLRAVKFGGQKKFCQSARFEPALPAMGRSADFFFENYYKMVIVLT